MVSSLYRGQLGYLKKEICVTRTAIAFLGQVSPYDDIFRKLCSSMAFIEVMRLSKVLLDKFHKTLFYIFCVQCRKPPNYGL